MILKIFAALVAVVLMLAFLVPPVLKLKEIDLGIVIIIGLVMMAVDLWQSMQKAD